MTQTPSRGQLLATLDKLDVQTRPEWQPDFGGAGVTHCNQAAQAAHDRLDALVAPAPRSRK